MPAIETLCEIGATTAWVLGHRAAGRRVGLVPTMGALHAGHLSLARRAVSECDVTLATVFVNPTQFAAEEDLDRYPRDLDADREALAAIGVSAVFAPAVEAMYPDGFATSIDVGHVARVLEGAARPTHFAGVATVVAKLMAIAPADAAYFGHKDYQQTVVIRRLAADLNLAPRVVVCPTVRDADGLAMSSRNAYLSADERERALSLSRGLRKAEALHAGGVRDAGELREAVLRELRAAAVEADYAAVLADGTVDPIEAVTGPAIVAVAARVGRTRLIDNVRLA
ncbi:MAG: pantoate--beta-alanine ligase [Planctomycetota bacterium]